MTTDQLRSQIEQQRRDEDVYIAWQSAPGGDERIEQIDYFLAQLIEQAKVAQFSLLDLEQLWQRLQQRGRGRFSRAWRKKVEVVDWQLEGADGQTRTRSCCFRAEGLLAIYEEATAPSSS